MADMSGIPRLRRMWVNQPSTLQPDHALHGTDVLVSDDAWRYGEDKYIDVWFLSGDVHSSRMAKLSLSDGWKNYGTSNDPTRVHEAARQDEGGEGRQTREAAD